MDFSILDIQPTQITIEAQNTSAYLSPGKLCVFINGERAGEYEKNVITIDGLKPGTEYELTLECAGEAGTTAKSMSFATKKETLRLNVRRFGAKGDGETNDTASLQAAIMAAPAGGTVYFDEGCYLTGPLFLKSNIRIHLGEGATILGVADRSAYPVLPGLVRSDEYFDGDHEEKEYDFGTWEGNPLDCHASLITGIDLQNVAIYGKGTIDGNAGASDWWVDPKKKRTAWRPHVVFLERCSRVTLQGIRICNSPCWTVLPYYCEDIDLLELTIRNPDDSPNTDGIDPESSTGVNIIGTDISVGDDCIAIKSGKYYMAENHFKRTGNVTVRNCLLNHGHGSVTIGSECSGGVRRVLVEKCIFRETDRGLRIKTRRGRGKKSAIADIVFEHIVMDHVRMPFTVNMYYYCDPDGHSDYCQSKEALPADDMTPVIESITARDITCTGVDVSLLAVWGLPESPVGRVTLEGIKASFLPPGERTPGIPLMMDDLEPMSGKGIFVRNVRELILKNLVIDGCDDRTPDLENVGLI